MTILFLISCLLLPLVESRNTEEFRNKAEADFTDERWLSRLVWKTGELISKLANFVSTHNFNDAVQRRKKRSFSQLVILGSKITQSLLVGARKLDPNSEKLIYKKKGGLERLKKDFYKYKPTGIQTYRLPEGGTGKAGRVADRILIYKNKNKGFEGKPTLEIYKAKEVLERDRKRTSFSELHHEVITYTD